MIAQRPEIDLKIDRWQDTLLAFKPLAGHEGQDEYYRNARPQVDVLFEIFNELKGRAGLKAEWKPQTFNANWEHFDIHEETKKAPCSFRFWLFEGKFGLSSYLIFGNYLRHATDKFWIELAHLCDETPVRWESCSGGMRKDKRRIVKELYGHKKSVFFSLLRNYLLGGLEDDWDDLGEFRLEWPLDGDWHEMLNTGAIAIRRIYNLNHHLWRWEYQTVYRNLKRTCKMEGLDFDYEWQRMLLTWEQGLG